MTSENSKDLTDGYPTIYTNVKTGEVIPVDKKLLTVDFSKPSKLLEGVEGFNNTTLTRYLRMKVWTLLQCALLAAGILPNDDSNSIPEFAMGLDHKPINKDDFRLREARRILIDLRGDSVPDQISPTDFFAWLKSRPDSEFHALRWLSEIEELKSETITSAQSLQRSKAQDDAILCEIKKQGYDPLALPKNPPGKSGVKAAIREALFKNRLFTGQTVFKKAWERLTASGDIVIKG